MFYSIDPKLIWAMRLDYCNSGDELPFYEHAFYLLEQFILSKCPNEYEAFKNRLIQRLDNEYPNATDKELFHALYESFADEPEVTEAFFEAPAAPSTVDDSELPF